MSKYMHTHTCTYTHTQKYSPGFADGGDHGKKLRVFISPFVEALGKGQLTKDGVGDEEDGDHREEAGEEVANGAGGGEGGKQAEGWWGGVLFL